MATPEEDAMKTKLDFEPNLMAVVDGCKPCALAKQLYGREIAEGKIRLVDIEEALEIEGFYDCVAKIGYAGVPVLARVEGNKVCKCSIGY